MKGACERCGAGLTADGRAFMCSFECTFCEVCAAGMDHVCPNCGGELVPRPRRVRSVPSVVAQAVRRRVRRG